MDQEQQRMQVLGFSGIVRESFVLISSSKKIFSQIALAFLFPICLGYFADLQISRHLIFTTNHGDDAPSDITTVSSSRWLGFAFFQIFSLVAFLVLDVVATSAVIHTILCVYAAKETTFCKSVASARRVWARLALTYLWNALILFLFFVAALVIAVGIGFLISLSKVVGIIILCVFVVLFYVGLLYLTTVFQIAAVGSVLEDVRCRAAMAKARALLKGKRSVAMVILFVFQLCFTGIHYLLDLSSSVDGAIGARIGLGILGLLLMPILLVVVLVLQTVIYLVCKAYHRESIGNSLISDYGKHVPMQELNV